MRDTLFKLSSLVLSALFWAPHVLAEDSNQIKMRCFVIPYYNVHLLKGDFSAKSFRSVKAIELAWDMSKTELTGNDTEGFFKVFVPSKKNTSQLLGALNYDSYHITNQRLEQSMSQILNRRHNSVYATVLGWLDSDEISKREQRERDTLHDVIRSCYDKAIDEDWTLDTGDKAVFVISGLNEDSFRNYFTKYHIQADPVTGRDVNVAAQNIWAGDPKPPSPDPFAEPKGRREWTGHFQ